MVLYLIGDRQKGIPPLDGNLAAIKAGLTVEVFLARDGLAAQGRAENDLVGLQRTVGFEVVGKPAIEEIALADGTKAVRLKVEVAKPMQRRLSFYEKVYCACRTTGMSSPPASSPCSPGGGAFVKKTGLTTFVEAHAESLVLDADKLGPERWKNAYESLDVRAGTALEKTREGNALLETRANVRAASAFREALAICDVVAAAHNGLAWACSRIGRTPDVPEAVRHAEAAVELTARRDPAALRYPGTGLRAKGDQTKAVAAIREALKLDPDNAELKPRWKRTRKGPHGGEPRRPGQAGRGTLRLRCDFRG